MGKLISIVRGALPVLVWVFLLAGTFVAPVAAEEPDLDGLRERVHQAIDRGAEWLKGQQEPAGSWPAYEFQGTYGGGSGNVYDYKAGVTAMSLYALLRSGVPADDPAIERGFDWLRENHEVPRTIYEVAVLCLAIEAKGSGDTREDEAGDRHRRPRLSQQDRSWMRRLVQVLERSHSGKGWRYTGPGLPNPVGQNPFGIDQDVSTTQIVLLGLRAASACGVDASADVYRETAAWLVEVQEKDGPAVPRAVEGYTDVEDRARGWGYCPGSNRPDDLEPTGSMTTAAIASLVICHAALERDAAYRSMRGDVQRAIYDGVAWVGEHWNFDENPGPRENWIYYYLYGIERIGRLGGMERIAGHAWYPEIAEELVDEQIEDGRWNVGRSGTPPDIMDSVFALLILTRSTPQVYDIGRMGGESGGYGVGGR